MKPAAAMITSTRARTPEASSARSAPAGRVANRRFRRVITIGVVFGVSLALVTGLNRGALAPQIVGMDTADGCMTSFVRVLFHPTAS